MTAGDREPSPWRPAVTDAELRDLLDQLGSDPSEAKLLPGERTWAPWAAAAIWLVIVALAVVLTTR